MEWKLWSKVRRHWTSLAYPKYSSLSNSVLEGWTDELLRENWRMEPGFQHHGLGAASLLGTGASPSWAFWSFDQSICLSPLSLQSPIVSLSPLNSSPLSLSLILPLMMMPKVVFENLGKIVRFCSSALYSPSWKYKSFSVLYYRCLRWRFVTSLCICDEMVKPLYG